MHRCVSCRLRVAQHANIGVLCNRRRDLQDGPTSQLDRWLAEMIKSSWSAAQSVHPKAPSGAFERSHNSRTLFINGLTVWGFSSTGRIFGSNGSEKAEAVSLVEQIAR